MQLTRKIRIYPTKGQEEVLWTLSEKCRLIYNFALTERKEGRVGYRKQQDDLPGLKEEYPEYGWVYSKVLQMTLRQLNADYKSYFKLRKKDSRARPPKYKGKKYFTTMVYNQSGFKVGDGRVRLSHFYNDVELSFAIPEEDFGRIYQVVVSEYEGKYYVSIVCEVETEEKPDNSLYQAIDLGITKTVSGVNTHGKFTDVINPRPDKYWNPKIDTIQSRMDHCKKGSRRWSKLRNAKRRCERKRSHQIKDNQHKLSRKIVNNTRANTIIIGDLSVKDMAGAARGLNRSTQNTGYLARFAGFLTYKGELAGKRVIEISEVNTTKECCGCGTKHHMPIGKRTMECDCGNKMDRDQNSAVNIMLRFLSQNALWTGYRQFADNLRQTAKCKVRTPESFGYADSLEAPCESVG